MIQTGPGASAPPSFHPKWEPIEAALKTCEPVHLTKSFCVFGHWAISVFFGVIRGGGHSLGSFVALILDGEACVLFCFYFFYFFSHTNTRVGEAEGRSTRCGKDRSVKTSTLISSHHQLLLPQSSCPASRRTAGAAGFLNLNESP